MGLNCMIPSAASRNRRQERSAAFYAAAAREAPAGSASRGAQMEKQQYAGDSGRAGFRKSGGIPRTIRGEFSICAGKILILKMSASPDLFRERDIFERAVAGAVAGRRRNSFARNTGFTGFAIFKKSDDRCTLAE